MRIVTELAGEPQGVQALQALGVNYITNPGQKVVNLNQPDGSLGFPMLSNGSHLYESTPKSDNLNHTPENVAKLIQIFDGGTEIKNSKRRIEHIENIKNSKILRVDIIPQISKDLELSINTLVQSISNEKNAYQAGGHARRNPHNDRVCVIEERHRDEILSILEKIKQVQQTLPNIIYIAPFYLGNESEAKKFSDILLQFNFWQEFPEYLGYLMPTIEISKFSKSAQNSVAVHYSHPFGRHQMLNHNLIRKIQKQYLETLPDAFPFIAIFGKEKSIEAVAYFEQILLLPLWAGKLLLGQNADRINPTLIAFFQKHKEYLLPYLQDETNVLTDKLVDIFGAEKVRDSITRYCLTSETREILPVPKKRATPRVRTPGLEQSSSQRIPVQLEGMNIRLGMPLPEGWNIEAKVGIEGTWKSLDGGYVDSLSENTYVEQEVFLRATPDKNMLLNQEGATQESLVLMPSMLKYRSQELIYLMKSAPNLRNEFIIRQVFLEGKKTQAQDLINYWNYPMNLLLWISIDEGKTWKSYHSEEDIEVTDFAGGDIQFAYSPEGESLLSGVRITKLTLQKKVTDIVGGTTRNVHEKLSITPSEEESVISPYLNPDEEGSLILYDALERGEYIIEKDELGNYRLMFTGEAPKGYLISYSPKNGELAGSPEDSILKGLIVLAQGELKTVFQQKIAEEEKRLDDTFIANLRPAEYYLQKLGAFLLKFSSIDTIIGNSAIFSALRNDSGFLGVGNFFNGKMEVLEGFQKALSEAGLIVDIKRTRLGNIHDENPRGTEMSLTLSLPGTSGAQGTISSTSSGNKYAIVCDESMSPVSKKRFENLLINALILLGVIGKYNSDESYAKKVTIQDISGVVSGKAVKLPQGILKDEKSQILETYNRFKTGEGKICEEFGFSHELGCYMNIIHSRQGLESIEGKAHNNFVVLVDEKLSSVPEGRSGQVEVYNLLQNNPRMQKYLALRIRETLLDDAYKGKSAFTGTMLDEFLNYWDSLAPTVRLNFLEAVQSSTDEALRVNEGNDIHISVISGLIEYWRTKKVQIIYSRPQLMPVDEFLSRVDILTH